MRRYVRQYNKLIAKGEAKFRLTLYVGPDRAAAWFDRAATLAVNAGDTQREFVAKWSALRCVRYNAANYPYMWAYVDRDYGKLLELVPGHPHPKCEPVRQQLRARVLREYAEIKRMLGGMHAPYADMMDREAAAIELALSSR